MKRTGLYVTGIVVVIVAIGVWQSRQPQAIVQVIKPQVQTLRAYIEEQAVTELPRVYLVALPIDGWLEPVALREGDVVKTGQIVARLDPADLADRVTQAGHRVAVLETKIAQTEDNRLENHAFVETVATVKAVDETVKASEAKLQAFVALTEFAQSEVERLLAMNETGATSVREMREAETNKRRAEAEQRGNALDLAALKTLAAVSYIGPQFIRDFIDRKSFELNTLRAQLAEAEAEFAIQKRNLDRAAMTSPVVGVVLERLQSRRQFLPAGTPVLTIGQLDEMEIVAEVLTQRATRLQPGDPVDVFGEAIGNNPVRGEVLRVYPAGFKKISSLGVEQQRVKVAIKLGERPPRLGVDFRVQVRIFHDEARDAQTLPRTALFRSSDGDWQVMVVSDGVTALRTVSVGLMNDDYAQILDGLPDDVSVVARPSREISPGMRVAIE